jgi:FKBP-type peptidyl-prolyl cis-trans isomerase/CpeT/CpcT family (DUF1001)
MLKELFPPLNEEIVRMFKVCLPCVLGVVLSTGFNASLAYAQDDQATEAQAYVAPDPYAPSWSDDEIATIAGQLTGTWKASESIEGDVSMMMSIAPAPVDGMNDTLYVESVRSNATWEPYRRAIFQLYRYKGDIRLRTYEFAIGDTAEGAFDGMWAAAELFPELSADDLIATLDVELESTPTGFTGATPYPYPTGVAGAVEMTSSVTLDGDSMTVADRGYNADGEVVWGADTGSVFGFERSEPYAQVNRSDDGMVIIDYGGDNGILPQDGDQLHVHYDGFIANGTRFDSSYARNQPFAFAFPPKTRAITGWGIGMEGFAMGNHRKLLIPGYLAYGKMGNPRANIPPDSMLYFNVFMLQIDHVEPAEQAKPVSGSTED